MESRVTTQGRWVEIIVSDCCDTCFAALRPGMIVLFEDGHLYCKSCVEKGKYHGKRKIFDTEKINIDPSSVHYTTMFP